VFASSPNICLSDQVIRRLESIPTSERQAAIQEAKREIYRSSLFATAKHLLGYSLMVPHAHGKLAGVLESPTRRKLIVMPRGTFKTSITSVAYPIWLLLRNPNLRIILDSELYTNSKNILREIKQHVEGNAFRELFGDWRGPVWNEGEIVIAPRAIVKKEASITCSGIGAQKTGQHYDVAILDDMNSPKNSATPEGCARVHQHYRYYQSLLEPEGSTLVIVGTRYSQGDLISFVLQNELGITNETEYFR
jgi:hypothetical protein